MGGMDRHARRSRAVRIGGRCQISGAIASSSIACDGDVLSWLRAVRTELSTAFEQAGQPVPDDVSQLGRPARWGGEVLLPPEDLWDEVANPPSFVTRVAVTATRREFAVAQARRALRAVFAQTSSHLASDLRFGARVWTGEHGWDPVSSTSRGRGAGEIFASETAGRAVARWAADLGTPLNPDQVNLLETRALVRDRDASYDVRLLRAFTTLDALGSSTERQDNAADGLWLFTAWEHAKRSLSHILHDIALQPISVGPQRDGAPRDATRRRIDAAKSRLATESVPWNMGVIDLVEDVMGDIDRHAGSRYFVDTVTRLLSSAGSLQKAKRNHAQAWQRARRHRNLSAHGWHLDDRVLAPTVAFLADQLENAIVADEVRHRHPELTWLGALGHPPDASWEDRTLADLLDALGAPQP